jgi:hypothetical protein
MFRVSYANSESYIDVSVIKVEDENYHEDFQSWKSWIIGRIGEIFLGTNEGTPW